MSTPSAYQKVVTQYDVTEAGVASIFYSVWDNTDDILPITLPAITGGTVALVGLNGIWIEDNWDYAGGTLDIGPTTIAGLPAGILDVVGDLCAVIINDRAWTAAERAGVVAWGKSRGAPGVFGLGPELVTNGTFDSDVSGWTPNSADAGLTWETGKMRVTNNAVTFARAKQPITSISAASPYLVRGSCLATSGIGVRLNLESLSPAGFDASTTPKDFSYLVTPSLSTVTFSVGSNNSTSGGWSEWDNISLRKLELIP